MSYTSLMVMIVYTLQMVTSDCSKRKTHSTNKMTCYKMINTTQNRRVQPKPAIQGTDAYVIKISTTYYWKDKLDIWLTSSNSSSISHDQERNSRSTPQNTRYSQKLTLIL